MNSYLNSNEHFLKYKKMIQKLSYKFSFIFNNDKEELFNELSLLYVKLLSVYKDSKSTFSTFLYTSCVNFIKDEIKKQNRKKNKNIIFEEFIDNKYSTHNYVYTILNIDSAIKTHSNDIQFLWDCFKNNVFKSIKTKTYNKKLISNECIIQYLKKFGWSECKSIKILNELRGICRNFYDCQY